MLTAWTPCQWRLAPRPSTSCAHAHPACLFPGLEHVSFHEHRCNHDTHLGQGCRQRTRGCHALPGCRAFVVQRIARHGGRIGLDSSAPRRHVPASGDGEAVGRGGMRCKSDQQRAWRQHASTICLHVPLVLGKRPPSNKPDRMPPGGPGRGPGRYCACVGSGARGNGSCKVPLAAPSRPPRQHTADTGVDRHGVAPHACSPCACFPIFGMCALPPNKMWSRLVRAKTSLKDILGHDATHYADKTVAGLIDHTAPASPRSPRKSPRKSPRESPR